MISLIDADSIIHIIAYNYREVLPENEVAIDEVKAAVDSFINMILTMTSADTYMGAIGHDTEKCFRYEVYKYARYKGNRPPPHEWVVLWKPYIRRQMKNVWGFIDDKKLEADDLVASMAVGCQILKEDYTICSPDKDLRQVPGRFYNYKATENQLFTIDKGQAFKNFWLQMLMGDSNDNIVGIPGIGEVKSKKLLDGLEPQEYGNAVKQAYCKYFGEYYGPIIFDETKKCIKMEVEEPVRIITHLGLNNLNFVHEYNGYTPRSRISEFTT